MSLREGIKVRITTKDSPKRMGEAGTLIEIASPEERYETLGFHTPYLYLVRFEDGAEIYYKKEELEPITMWKQRM